MNSVFFHSLFFLILLKNILERNETMIERAVPKDILKYEAKMFAGMTARQLIFIGAACAVALGMWSCTSFIIDFKVRIFFIAIPAVIPLLFGFVTIMGQPLEKIGLDIFIDTFLTPPVRRKETHFPELEKMEKAFEVTEEDGKVRKLKVDKEGKVVVKRSQTIRTIR